MAEKLPPATGEATLPPKPTTESVVASSPLGTVTAPLTLAGGTVVKEKA